LPLAPHAPLARAVRASGVRSPRRLLVANGQ
jgi:hypothetical protein